MLSRVDLFDLVGREIETIACRDYFASGKFQTARSCEIDNLASGVRSTITVRETSHDSGLDPTLFSVANLTAGG